MKTDKLYYRIFLSYPALLAELLPGLPADCTFEYVAPVIKETEFRLDGLLMPQSEDPEIPVIFLEAQMQPDSRFYGRYFAELFLYLYQYRIERPWRGLLILQSPQQDLGSDVPYADLLDGKVQRIYLQDLVGQTELPPALALLQLLVLPKSSVAPAAKRLLENTQSQGTEAFRRTLDLVEAILVNKFPQLTTQEILAMLDIKTADIRQTRFYQEVFQEGREEGREEGAQQAEAGLLVRLLARNLGALSEEQEAQVRALSLEQLDALGDALFDVADHDALTAWLQAHPVEPRKLEEE
jgi:predicted transposase/invertase (TIGR01784 family)